MLIPGINSLKKSCMCHKMNKYAYVRIIACQTLSLTVISSSSEDQNNVNGSLTPDFSVHLVKSTIAHCPDGKHC